MNISYKTAGRFFAMTILSALELINIAASGFGSLMLLGVVISVMWGSTTQDWQYTRYLAPITVSLLLGGKLFYEAGTRFTALISETFFDEASEIRKTMDDYKRVFEKSRKQHFKNTYDNSYKYEYVTPSYDMKRINVLNKSIEIMGIPKDIKINEEIIKKAYRKKAKSLHPDLNKGYDTTEDMQKLNEAKNNLEEDYQYWNKYLEGE